MQLLFKNLGYILQLLFMCWALGMIFTFFIVHINKDISEDYCDGENFFQTDFKGEDTCFNEKSINSQILIMFYYISTTLSTVGLGDYRPISDSERVEIIPYLLFGYLIFSYLIGEMQEISKRIHEQFGSNEDLRGLN